MYFTGEAASNFENTVLAVVEDVLKTGFAAPAVAAKFKRFGGVQITRDPARGLLYFSEKRPFLFLQLDQDEPFAWNKVVNGALQVGERHEISITVECVCHEACADAERPLKDAARDVLNGAYAALRNAGLEGSKARVMKAEEQPTRRCPVELSARVHTL